MLSKFYNPWWKYEMIVNKTERINLNNQVIFYIANLNLSNNPDW